MRDYLVLLIGEETEADDPSSEEFWAEIALYERFNELAEHAIVDGHALEPSTLGITFRYQADGPVLVTDGPYTEATEVAGGLYVLRAEDLDEVIELARHIPAASKGCVEIRPMVSLWRSDTPRPDGNDRYLALLRCKDDGTVHTPTWDATAAQRAIFEEGHRASLLSGATLHPGSMATTLRVRDGQPQISDGPFADPTEVVGGYYLLHASSRPEAAAIAQDIPLAPGGFIELRPRVESRGA